MGVEIPDLSAVRFRSRLESAIGSELEASVYEALYAHYRELRRWSPKLALVGPGTVDELVERHYAESLAPLPLLQGEGGVLLDLGSGAGFPGFVLAAACPHLGAFLVEARQRKCAFLAAAARRAGLTTLTPLPVRLSYPLPAELPPGIDFLTLRAIKPAPAVWKGLAERLKAGGLAFWWVGREDPELPNGLAVTATLPLPGGMARRILVLKRQPSSKPDLEQP